MLLFSKANKGRGLWESEGPERGLLESGQESEQTGLGAGKPWGQRSLNNPALDCTEQDLLFTTQRRPVELGFWGPSHILGSRGKRERWRASQARRGVNAHSHSQSPTLTPLGVPGQGCSELRPEDKPRPPKRR